MWISTLCTFPPPLSAIQPELRESNAVIKQNFEVPLDHHYTMTLRLTHPSSEARLNSPLLGLGICGNNGVTATSAYAGENSLPLKITISEAKSGHTVFEQKFFRPCKLGHTSIEETLQLADLFLAKGNYRIEITTLQPNLAYASLRPSISIVAPRMK